MKVWISKLCRMLFDLSEQDGLSQRLLFSLSVEVFVVGLLCFRIKKSCEQEEEVDDQGIDFRYSTSRIVWIIVTSKYYANFLAPTYPAEVNSSP
jgi:hypothetical protein